MILMELVVLCSMILASIAGVSRSRESYRFDRFTSFLSRWLSAGVALILFYLTVAGHAAWLLPLSFLVALKIDSYRSHRYFDEFLLLPFVTAEVYALIFFPGLREFLSGAVALLLSLSLQFVALVFVLKNLHAGAYKQHGPHT